MTTKTESLPFPVPRHFRWVAQDSSGVWWGYTAEPHRNDSGWYENEVGECRRLATSAPIDWEHSLIRIR